MNFKKSLCLILARDTKTEITREKALVVLLSDFVSPFPEMVIQLHKICGLRIERESDRGILTWWDVEVKIKKGRRKERKKKV